MRATKEEELSQGASLSEEDRRALRGSKFAPLPSSSRQSQSFNKQPRLAHPGGPLKTNKAAALAKFLQRKLQQPNGLATINPDLLERAVNNAKHTLTSSAASTSGRIIQHVSSFEEHVKVEDACPNKQNRNNKKKKIKRKKQRVMDDPGCATLKKPKKKKKL